jgi:lipoyl(octanoyl) transferase
MNLAKQPPPADFVGVVEIGRRRIGILGGTVTDNEKGALRLWRDGHGGKLARLERNARPWHSVLSFALPILVLDAENPAIACDDPRELVLESGQERAKTAGMFERLQLWLDPKPRNGPEAMAVDEWLLETTTIPILRVYRWLGNWGSLGYFGKLEEAKVLMPEVQWVRRWTGGGLVDHRADWTYTLVVPISEPIARMKGAESYRQIHTALLEVLNHEGRTAALSGGENQTGAAQCFQNPVFHDIVAENGEKLAGAGQRRTRKGLLHQGSVAGLCQPSLSLGRGLALGRVLCGGVQEMELALSSRWIEDKIANRYGQASWASRR